MSETEIKIPNIGDFRDVEVIEVLVSEGQTIQKNDPLITIESDKSSIEIPSNYEGKIKSLKTKVGDKVSEGDLILTLEGKLQTEKSDEIKQNIEKEFKKIKVTKPEIEQTSIKQVKSSSLPQVFLGEMTARRLNLNLGDAVRLLSPIDNGSAWGLPIQAQCIVGGIFSIQVLDLDDKVAFIPKKIGQKLFLRKDGPDGLDIRLHENSDIQMVVDMIKSNFPEATIKKWSDLHTELFNAMKFERFGALFVLSLIIVVACFNLITTLILVSAQKIRQIGILQVMGCSKKSIKSIIMNQGLMIGSIGIFTGSFIAIFFIKIQNNFGLIPLPEDIYFISSLPMDIYFYDIFTILSISFGMVILSVIIAAKRTTMISTLEAVYLEK